jgi:hypothetical protein
MKALSFDSWKEFNTTSFRVLFPDSLLSMNMISPENHIGIDFDFKIIDIEDESLDGADVTRCFVECVATSFEDSESVKWFTAYTEICFGDNELGLLTWGEEIKGLIENILDDDDCVPYHCISELLSEHFGLVFYHNNPLSW